MASSLDIDGLLLDMDGVLYVGDQLVDGALDAVERLRRAGLPIRFITNTTTRPPQELMEKLKRLGLEVDEGEIYSAVTATRLFLEARGKPSCHLLVRESVKPLFERFPQDVETPDYIVVGDIGASWDYETLNEVFNRLMRGSKLLCMHRNKYWQEGDGLRMDIGAFVAALEYVADARAIVIGKPAPAFFQQALRSLDLPAERVAIVGDDIESDVGGGQACGLVGVLTRTGKYRETLASRSSTRPDFTIDSIAALPELLG